MMLSSYTNTFTNFSSRNTKNKLFEPNSIHMHFCFFWPQLYVWKDGCAGTHRCGFTVTSRQVSVEELRPEVEPGSLRLTVFRAITLLILLRWSSAKLSVNKILFLSVKQLIKSDPCEEMDQLFLYWANRPPLWTSGLRVGLPCHPSRDVLLHYVFFTSSSVIIRKKDQK